MSEIVYTEFHDKEVREFLHDVHSKLKNIEGGKKEYTGLLSAIIYEDIIRHFEEEKGSAVPWKQWSKSYREKMEAEGKGGNKILQDNGRLRQNFKPSKVRRTNQGFLWFNDAQTNSGFPYAAAHDTGGKKLPKRDFMWASDTAMEKISIQTLSFLIEKGI